MSNKTLAKDFEKAYDLSRYKEYSEPHHRALSLMAELGLARYKIAHSQVIADCALLIADEVEKQTGYSPDREVCDLGALLHDIGLVLNPADDLQEHGYVGAVIAEEAGFSVEVAKCIAYHDCAGLTQEFCELLNIPIYGGSGKKDMVPETWEEKIVAYADQLISHYGEWQFDVWADDSATARAAWGYLTPQLRGRLGVELPFDHPQYQRLIEFNREMRKFAPKERVDAELRSGIDRMVREIKAHGLQHPFKGLDSWPVPLK